MGLDVASALAGEPLGEIAEALFEGVDQAGAGAAFQGEADAGVMLVETSFGALGAGGDALGCLLAEGCGGFPVVLVVPPVAPALRVGVGGLVAALAFDGLFAGGMGGVPRLLTFWLVGLLAGVV
jgi:hypothetical protein